MNWQLRDPGFRQDRSGKAGYARFFVLPMRLIGRRLPFQSKRFAATA
ncbi:hypothetical protein HB770_00450 [Rhizobium leguminosarum bv. viciae]|uniref:Uncharacterized protein n=1 Tax=Rhizobium leguminosarum bv. viciae TaxID=387 RepID=A0A7G6RH49_RHILV|nr:hypothetical protein HB770_00450 [Rhizobium leguminosarum bv. viciae]